MDIYRCEPDPAVVGQRLSRRGTRRVPSHTPYLVDNLWEWRRPEKFPSRRHAVFASTTPQSALENGRSDGVLCRVQFQGRCDVCQTPEFEDARMHPECRTLPLLVLKILGRGWPDAPLPEKAAAAPLWAPCLAKEEVESVIAEIPELRAKRDRLWEFIHYWEDVRLWTHPNPQEAALSPRGEIFFEPRESFTLVRVEEGQ